MTRRRHLQLLATSFSMVAIPASAQDPFTTAAVSIQLGQAVLGLFAAKRRGPDMAQVMLSAVLDNQRIMAQQLESLQSAIASIISHLGQFDERLRMGFDMAALRQLHAQLAAIEPAYERTLNDAGSYLTYQAWIADKNVQRDLHAVAVKCDDAVDFVSSGSRLDAVTMMLLAAVMKPYLVVNIALNRNQVVLKNRAQSILDVFERSSDEDSPGSTAQALARNAEDLAQVRRELTALGVELPLEGQSRPVLLSKVRVQDYIPASEATECRTVLVRRGGGGRRGGEPGPDNLQEICEVRRKAEFLGQSSAFDYVVQVTSMPMAAGIAAPAEVSALLSYVMKPETSMAPSPTAEGARVHRTQASKLEDRTSVAEGLVVNEGIERKSAVRLLLARHNQYAGLTTLNAVALSTMSDTRREVFSIFGVPL
jgi:hypothetical protein